MTINKEITGKFLANAEEHEDSIALVGKTLRDQLMSFGWDGCDWFTYVFPDGTKADCEVWMQDDGAVYVTAYRQFTNDEGDEDTDTSCFHQCGMIDCEPSVAYRIEVWES